MTSSTDPGPETTGTPGLAPVLVIIPTYNEAENIEAHRLPGAEAVPGSTSSSPTTTAPTAPASSPTSWPPRTTRSSAAPQGQGRPRRGLPGGFPLGPGQRATTCWSRWTPTARTSPSSCRGC